ncbi:MAG: type II toxin-antitoxin system HigB family toxin [Acetobacteraceae bacterium]|nr:type II toxin-antitoxin system HigB family toxin [Acetobacteraceae bacterium]
MMPCVGAEHRKADPQAVLGAASTGRIAAARVWYALASRAEWTGPAEARRMFGATVDFIGDNGLIFDVAGNRDRLVVHVAYRFGRVLMKFVGTHAEYDRIDPGSV